MGTKVIKMEDNISKYELLLIKDLEGGLSPEGKQELDKWLRDPHNQTLYDQQKKIWISSGDLRKMRALDTKKALRKVEVQLFGRFAFHWMHTLERVAAILFIPLFLAAAWFFHDSYSICNAENRLVYNTIEIPSGTKSRLMLPDGTHVWLNAGSSLTYPVVFNGPTRNVELDGEVFFEVTENRNKPFIVSAGDLNIKVLGTSFNCSAYAGDKTIETALVEGSMEISGKKGENKFILSSGQLAVYTKKQKAIYKSETNLDKYVAWKSGKLMFRDDPMERVIDKLGRWYGVTFRIEDTELLKYAYSATFSAESLDQVLKMLSLSAPINFEYLSKEKGNNTSEKQIIRLTKK